MSEMGGKIIVVVSVKNNFEFKVFYGNKGGVIWDAGEVFVKLYFLKENH